MMKQRTRNYDITYRKLDKESGSDDETELFIRSKPRREIPTVEKLIENGDTLQSLAIQNHCSIEELKRLNNIHKENEIFARRTIKVPHRPFTMALAGVHISGKSSPDEINLPSTSKTIDIKSLNSKLTENVHARKESEVNEIIFNSNIISNNEHKIESCEIVDSDEEIRLLPQQEELLSPETVSNFNCNGTDCGISWISLIVCGVIVILAVPLIYVFYIAEHPEQYHHQSVS